MQENLIDPEDVATAMLLNIAVETAEIESKGKSTRFPHVAVPYTRLSVTVIDTLETAM